MAANVRQRRELCCSADSGGGGTRLRGSNAGGVAQLRAGKPGKHSTLTSRHHYRARMAATGAREHGGWRRIGAPALSLALKAMAGVGKGISGRRKRVSWNGQAVCEQFSNDNQVNSVNADKVRQLLCFAPSFSARQRRCLAAGEWVRVTISVQAWRNDAAHEQHRRMVRGVFAGGGRGASWLVTESHQNGVLAGGSLL